MCTKQKQIGPIMSAFGLSGRAFRNEKCWTDFYKILYDDMALDAIPDP
jgi:hypothetical protein